MILKRVQVEEGFLNGLNLELGYGLTVLIGARGSGKTSIIELIRFCLDVPSYSPKAAAAALKQAREVLGSGKVTVTLEVDGEEVIISRSALESEPRRSSDRTYQLPIILSQSEIEQVGLREDSRQRLLDGFVASIRENTASEDAARALIASLTVELQEVRAEHRATIDELHRLSTVTEQLTEAKAAALDANANIEQTAPQRERLEQLDRLAAQGSVTLGVLERAESGVQQWVAAMGQLVSLRELDPWPAAAGSLDQLAEVRLHLQEAQSRVAEADARVRAARGLAQELRQQQQASQLALEDEARTIRTFLEQLSEGAGALLKRVSDLEAAQQRAAALNEHATHLAARADAIHVRREAELDRLDSLRETRINAREQAAAFLNNRLGPKIRVTVNRFGSVSGYADAIAEALRGSGLQYNVLAPELASIISPRELASAAEDDAPQRIVDITGISFDRAQRLVTHLRSVGTEEVLTAPLGDTVHLSLLDGGTYKLADELSVGQRCTAVLPIILTHTDQVLIVDQPEDNLDNSFIAETLVKALRNRATTSQLIFATHNPNVPVLGEADKVVYMTSDGKRGEVDHDGSLDDVESVRAISNVMEGGREAFATRAAFYATEYPTNVEE